MYIAENPKQSGEARSITDVVRDIVLNGGVQGLYHGICPVLQSLSLSNFVYFYVFHSLKALSAARVSKSNVDVDQHEINAIKDLLLGSIAGIVNVLLTAPFWVVNARMRTTHRPNFQRYQNTKMLENKDTESIPETELYPYRNLMSGLVHIAKTEGIKTLWSGTIPSLILVSNPALQFMMYELLKRHTLTYLLEHERKMHPNDITICDRVEIPSIGYFIIGAIAKTFATVFTYPFQLIQTQLRIKSRRAEVQQEIHMTNENAAKMEDNKESAFNDDERKTNGHAKDTSSETVCMAMGMIQVFFEIIQFQGFKGLFRGMSAKILQTVLTTAFMFMAYEKINRIVRDLFL